MKPRTRPAQADTDPLPYIQVDRAALAVASRLGQRLGVSNQHALGSLVHFWAECGDPRELEALVRAGKREVIKGPEELCELLHAAFGQVVELKTMRALGLVEERGAGFKVRGMSRFFRALEGRVSKSIAGAAGGKNSAEARRRRHGSAQPRRAPGATESASGSASNAASGSASDSASGSGSAAPGSEGARSLNVEARAEAPPNTAHSAQRTATPLLLELPVAPKRAGPADDAGARLSLLTTRLTGIYAATRGCAYSHGGAKDASGLRRLLSIATDDEIARTWEDGLRASGWASCSTLAQLASKWNDLRAPRGLRAPVDAARGTGPLDAREVHL